MLAPFISTLSEKHIYITHIDSKPADFKRKVFLIPVAMNICVVIFFILRMYWILPWYWKLLASAMGHHNETTFPADEATWKQGIREILSRVLTMAIDFLLFAFVWHWPVFFVIGQAPGNPVYWRWNVGFREKEIYVRRSRSWDTALNDILKDQSSRKILLAYVHEATSPIVQEQKTGYVLMNKQWDLGWEEMVHAHALVDKKDIALEAFKNVVLIHHKDYGWLRYDVADSFEDERRRQVFAFRDALTAMGKEHLFYRWVEMVQFESTQPGGFGPEQQEATAGKIKGMFLEEGIDFEQLWQQTARTGN